MDQLHRRWRRDGGGKPLVRWPRCRPWPSEKRAIRELLTTRVRINITPLPHDLARFRSATPLPRLQPRPRLQLGFSSASASRVRALHSLSTCARRQSRDLSGIKQTNKQTSGRDAASSTSPPLPCPAAAVADRRRLTGPAQGHVKPWPCGCERCWPRAAARREPDGDGHGGARGGPHPSLPAGRARCRPSVHFLAVDATNGRAALLVREVGDGQATTPVHNGSTAARLSTSRPALTRRSSTRTAELPNPHAVTSERAHWAPAGVGFATANHVRFARRGARRCPASRLSLPARRRVRSSDHVGDNRTAADNLIAAAVLRRSRYVNNDFYVSGVSNRMLRALRSDAPRLPPLAG